MGTAPETDPSVPWSRADAPQTEAIGDGAAAGANADPDGDRAPGEAGSLAAILDAIDSLVVVVDRQGRIVRTNAAWEALSGHNSGEMVGTYLWDLIPSPDKSGEVKRTFDRLRSGKFPIRLEDYWLTKDGRRRLIAWSVTALLDGRGVVEYLIGTGVDITESRVAEEALRESEERYRTLIEAMEDAVHVRDRDERFVLVNSATARRLGRREDEILGRTSLELHPPEVAAQIIDADRRVLETGRVVEALEEYPDRDFAQVCHVKKVPLRSRQGEIIGVVTVSRDVTESRKVEEALRAANEKLTRWVGELEVRNREAAMVNEMGELLQTCDAFTDAYRVLTHMMPRLFPETSGGLYMISASRNLADAACTWGKIPECAQHLLPNECWGLRLGRAHFVEDSTSGLVCRHLHEPWSGGYLCIPVVAQGETLGLFHLRYEAGAATEAVQRLATTVAGQVGMALANLRLRQTLRDQAVRDQLTGLFNRRYMEEMLDRELLRATRRGSHVGMVMLDIDHFKQFNDLFGHEAGDALLSALGGYLRAHVRSEDVACRYGGEELTVILPDAGLEDTRRRAEDLLEGIRHLRVEHRRETLGPITVSMGVAAFPVHGKTVPDIVRAADQALYRAKAEGRDRVASAFSPGDAG